MSSQIIGSRGHIAWFEGIIYNRVRKACKNLAIKILVHSIGLILMVIGLFYLITTFPSIMSVGGLLLMFIGFVVFMTPLGA